MGCGLSSNRRSLRPLDPPSNASAIVNRLDLLLRSAFSSDPRPGRRVLDRAVACGQLVLDLIHGGRIARLADPVSLIDKGPDFRRDLLGYLSRWKNAFRPQPVTSVTSARRR